MNVIDLNEEIDREGLYKSFRRYMLGREHVNMSDMYPAYFILNGASSELYNNDGESKVDFMKMSKERHIAPVVLELDPSHGKYTADQKPNENAKQCHRNAFHFYARATRSLCSDAYDWLYWKIRSKTRYERYNQHGISITYKL